LWHHPSPYIGAPSALGVSSGGFMTDYAAARQAMVDRQIRPSDVTRYAIIAALLDIPRETFVPERFKPVAYLGEHVPLAEGRVLLDPRTFAKMLEALAIDGDDLLLDVGCGLGYSAAVAARVVEAVVAVEADPQMAAEAEARLGRIGADNVAVHAGPLAAGAPEHGPYDAVMIEGGVERLPEAICDQVKVGGRICAIFVDGVYGQARLGVRTEAGIGWRRVFDATAPVLPGFERAKSFEF
jgi:protein-L-isoaspartate(D-aspartate) O-methyltransferase